jgi:gliding motility-associated protein GldC
VYQKEIKFRIEQDAERIPEKIYWEATDNPNEGLEETRAIMVGVWDQFNSGTMFIPLWNKEMDVLDMKRFCIEMLGCIADTVATATGDDLMFKEIDNLGHKLSQRLMEEMKTVK